MPERQPLSVPVRFDQLLPALAQMPPVTGMLFMQLVGWMVANASPLPCDLQECCRIAQARSNEARRAISILTGLSVTGYGNALQDGGLGNGYGNALQGEAFEGSPEHGLTLRHDRVWGIQPLSAVEQIDKQRQRIRDRVRKHRAKAGNALQEGDGNGLLVCVRNSGIPNTNTEEKERSLLLPSVVVASAARALTPAHEDEGQPEVGGTEAGRLRGAKLAVMRRTGLAGCNGGDPRFVALVAGGVSDDELAWAADKAIAQGKGFPWAMAALQGARQDAAAGTPAPIAPGAPRLSAAEARASSWAGPLGVAWKPPT